MKIKTVKIKNFRNIENLEEEINGSNIIILGDNQVGKSNFLKAIQIALGLTELVGEEPVTKGKLKSSIEVVTDDQGNEYTFEVKFLKDSNKAVLSVTAPDGTRDRTKTMIGSIVGEIGFDIDEFVEMSKTTAGRKKQVEIVKSFLSEDVRQELRKYENQIETSYNDRTDLNREAKTLQGFINESEMSDDDLKTYMFPEDADKSQAELSAAIVVNQNRTKAISAIEESKKLVEKNNIEIARLQAENDAASKKMQLADSWLSGNPEIEITVLQEKMKKITEHNLKHQKVNDVRAKQKKLDEINAESENLTIMIESKRQLISDTIKDLDMPIEALSFTDDLLTYNGLPVDESTMSTSEIMMLGLRLKIAKNPNAKVLCIERGESLGLQKLNDLKKMAKDHGFQIIMEQVQRGNEKLTIEFMPE